MSSAPGKSGRGRGKPSQPKIDFGPTKQTGKAKASAMSEESISAEEEGPSHAPILEAIRDLKTDFSNRFDGIMAAIEGVRNEVGECKERIVNVETRISDTEDTVDSLQRKVQSLEKKTRDMEDKVMDLETRARRANLRLVNLPEKVEGTDACAFLETWIPETLDIPLLKSKPFLERAHRIGPRNDPNAPPRTLIMKFLSDRDKAMVLKATKIKKQILYEDKPVRFYPDMAAGIHKMQKEFDSVRRQLRSMGIRHGMLLPARLLVTYKDKTLTFGKPEDAETFVTRIQAERDE